MILDLDTKVKTKATLEDVAEFFETHDWIKGRAWDGRNGFCLSGAMDVIAGYDFTGDDNSNYDERIYSQLWSAFQEKTGHTPIGYNDNLAQSKEDIIDVLKS